MTQTVAHTDGQVPGHVLHKPVKDHDASKDMPGRQHEILDTVTKIFMCVEPSPAAD